MKDRQFVKPKHNKSKSDQIKRGHAKQHRSNSNTPKLFKIKTNQQKNTAHKKKRFSESSPQNLWETESKWLESIRLILGPNLGYPSSMLTKLNKTHLLEALTHRTYAHEHKDKEIQLKDNQRLEFLGDAILGYISTTKLYEYFPNLNEGELSALRATLINRTSLRDVALEAGLEPFLRLGRGEVKMGEAARDARLADLSEAIIASLYLDLGIEVTTLWIWPFLDKLIQPTSQNQKAKSRDPKTDLQHWSHQRHKLTPYYNTDTVEAKVLTRGSNKSEERYYRASVYIGNECVGHGQGRTKREAQRKAAQDALDKLDFLNNYEL